METISSVADARRAQEYVEFMHKVDSLHDSIRFKIEELRNLDEPELKEVNEFMAGQMEELLNIPINDEDTLDYVEWLYNYGDLRTEEEIAEREKAINDSYYIDSGQYESDCKANKTAWGVCGFLAGFLITLAAVEDFHNPAIFLVIGWMVCGFIGTLCAFIGMLIASGMNIETAKLHNVPKNHPRYQHDRRELALGGVSGVIAAGTIARKAHKTAKDIGNVDSWKEMK